MKMSPSDRLTRSEVAEAAVAIVIALFALVCGIGVMVCDAIIDGWRYLTGKEPL